MKKVKLSKLVGETFIIEYPSESFNGKITVDEAHGRFYYHLAFKSEEKKGDSVEDCVKTVFLVEENLRFGEGKLVSKKDFYPVWTHRRYDPEYFTVLGKLGGKK